MNGCKYNEVEFVDGKEHNFCTNEELKKINHTENPKFVCMAGGIDCGRFEPIETEKNGSVK